MAEQTKNVPPLGDHDIVPSRRCTRLIGWNDDGTENLCDADAVTHIDWGERAGFVCATHKAELDTRWTYRAIHDLGGCCGMPGSMWFDTVYDGVPFSWCAMDGDELPTAEPVRAVALEVPA